MLSRKRYFVNTKWLCDVKYYCWTWGRKKVLLYFFLLFSLRNLNWYQDLWSERNSPRCDDHCRIKGIEIQSLKVRKKEITEEEEEYCKNEELGNRSQTRNHGRKIISNFSQFWNSLDGHVCFFKRFFMIQVVLVKCKTKLAWKLHRYKLAIYSQEICKKLVSFFPCLFARTYVRTCVCKFAILHNS